MRKTTPSRPLLNFQEVIRGLQTLPPGTSLSFANRFQSDSNFSAWAWLDGVFLLAVNLLDGELSVSVLIVTTMQGSRVSSCVSNY